MSHKEDARRQPWFNMYRFVTLATLICVLLIWVAVTAIDLVPPLFLPSPGDIMGALSQEFTSLPHNIGLTILRVVAGWLVGSGAGIGVAVLSQWRREISLILDPMIQILRPIPSLVLLPFVGVWFGYTFKAFLVFVSLGCFLYLVVLATEEIKNVAKVYTWTARTLGASAGQIYRLVVVPSIVPHIIGGLRASIVLSFNNTALYEFMGAAGGVGVIVVKGYRYFRSPPLFLGVILFVILALCFDLLFLAISRYVTRWVG